MSIRLRFLLAGFCIGLAELLPGISGATVALMFGIYKKLIECISKLKDLDLLAVSYTHLTLPTRLMV